MVSQNKGLIFAGEPPALPEVSQNKEAADKTFDKILWDITHKNFTNKFYLQTIK